jgi:hypothetical protein
MAEGSDGTRFALETVQPVGIGCEGWRKNFYGDDAVEPGIVRAIDFPHAPCP